MVYNLVEGIAQWYGMACVQVSARQGLSQASPVINESFSRGETTVAGYIINLLRYFYYIIRVIFNKGYIIRFLTCNFNSINIL